MLLFRRQAQQRGNLDLRLHRPTGSGGRDPRLGEVELRRVHLRGFGGAGGRRDLRLDGGGLGRRPRHLGLQGHLDLRLELLRLRWLRLRLLLLLLQYLWNGLRRLGGACDGIVMDYEDGGDG